MYRTVSSASPVVTVFGGSGFLGRHIVRALVKRGWRVRVAVRSPNEALFLKTAGAVGQVAIMQANIRDEASVRKAVKGVDAVVNLVGILYETGSRNFLPFRQKVRAPLHNQPPMKVLKDLYSFLRLVRPLKARRPMPKVKPPAKLQSSRLFRRR